MTAEAEHDKFKVHFLTGRITDQLMADAFKPVRKNRGAAGVDKFTIEMFEENLEQNLSSLKKHLRNRPYQPAPLRREYIPKGDGRQRPLGIPAIRDRVAL